MMTYQKHTSAGTSVNTVARTFTHTVFPEGAKVLDFGGGRFDTTTEYMAERGVQMRVYDPFNRSEEHNLDVKMWGNLGVDFITCNNVLNVIDNVDTLRDVVLSLFLFCGNPTYRICVYEGDKSGIGRTTKKDCYQRNEKLAAYLPVIERYFDIVSIKHGIIECVKKGGWLEEVGLI